MVISPWAKGAFELIKHANDHLLLGGDFDRRIALIGFDNAIEISIDVFLKLHPKLRGGVQIPRDDLDKASQNFHTKIEFLDSYVTERNVRLAIPIDALVWYHQLRNELYHSGNGMVPELHVLEGARSASISVFENLFNVQISTELGLPINQTELSAKDLPSIVSNTQMEFLRKFIDFEQTLINVLQSIADKTRPFELKSVRQLWEMYKDISDEPDKETDEIVNLAIKARNLIAHGHTETSALYDLENLYLKLDALINELRTQIKDHNFDRRGFVGDSYSDHTEN